MRMVRISLQRHGIPEFCWSGWMMPPSLRLQGICRKQRNLAFEVNDCWIWGLRLGIGTPPPTYRFTMPSTSMHFGSSTMLWYQQKLWACGTCVTYFRVTSHTNKLLHQPASRPQAFARTCWTPTRVYTHKLLYRHAVEPTSCDSCDI